MEVLTLIDEIQKEHKDLTTLYDKTRSEVAALDTKNKKLLADISNATVEQAGAQREYEHLSTKAEITQTELRLLQQTLDETNNKISETKQATSSVENKKQRLCTQFCSQSRQLNKSILLTSGGGDAARKNQAIDQFRQRICAQYDDIKSLRRKALAMQAEIELLKIACNLQKHGCFFDPFVFS